MQTFTDYFKEQYPKYEYLLPIISHSIGRVPEWQDLTKTNLIKVRKSLVEMYAPNTAKTYVAIIKSTLNQVKEEVNIPCRNFSEVLQVRKVASTAVWTTEQEVEQLSKVRTRTNAEQYTLTMYLIQAYTGARVSDATKFTTTNITNDRLSYVSEKTGIAVTIPVKPKVRELIERIPLLTPISNVTYCKVIKELCARAGISAKTTVFKGGKDVTEAKFNLISTHTARRSFATNLYLRGLDLYAISKYMGHASTAMTENYLCCGVREVDDKVKSFFE